MNLPLPCILCGAELESACLSPFSQKAQTQNQPYGGTTFLSHGQYGSTVWDPLGGGTLEVNFCDKCLTEKAAAGLVLYVAPEPFTPAPPRKVQLWDGELGLS